MYNIFYLESRIKSQITIKYKIDMSILENVIATVYFTLRLLSRRFIAALYVARVSSQGAS